jgi:hypothetical protein
MIYRIIYIFSTSIGFIDKEIIKEKDLNVPDADENCEALKPKDMIPLEVFKS